MSDLGVIERIYYAVPTHYTIGTEFPGTPEGHREAVAAAKATIRQFDFPSGPSYSRAWVDLRYVIRWLPASGQNGGTDRVIERNEILLTDTEKKELVPA